LLFKLADNNQLEISTTWGDYKIPLVFATNGRSYLKQLEQESGIWFLDVRDNTHQRRALQGWYTPQEIKSYLKQNPQQAEQQLQQMDFGYAFTLRPIKLMRSRRLKTASNRVHKPRWWQWRPVPAVKIRTLSPHSVSGGSFHAG